METVNRHQSGQMMSLGRTAWEDYERRSFEIVIHNDRPISIDPSPFEKDFIENY